MVSAYITVASLGAAYSLRTGWPTTVPNPPGGAARRQRPRGWRGWGGGPGGEPGLPAASEGDGDGPGTAGSEPVGSVAPETIAGPVVRPARATRTAATALDRADN